MSENGFCAFYMAIRWRLGRTQDDGVGGEDLEVGVELLREFRLGRWVLRGEN